jgi:hypothetical protein
MLLSECTAKCLEAHADITYVNSYDAWMEEAARREEGRNEDSDSPTSAGSRKRRRFTEKSKGSGKFKGWDKSGIRLYNKINRVLDKQTRSDESLVEFDKNLKTWFLIRIQVLVHRQMMMSMIVVRMRLQPTTLFARGGTWKRWDKWANKLNFRPGRMN